MNEDKKCTCHPDDNPPIPCAKQYAFSECVNFNKPNEMNAQTNREPKYYTTEQLLTQLRIAYINDEQEEAE